MYIGVEDSNKVCWHHGDDVGDLGWDPSGREVGIEILPALMAHEWLTQHRAFNYRAAKGLNFQF